MLVSHSDRRSATRPCCQNTVRTITFPRSAANRHTRRASVSPPMRPTSGCATSIRPTSISSIISNRVACWMGTHACIVVVVVVAVAVWQL